MLKDFHLLIGYVLLVLGLSEATYLPQYEYIQGVGWLRLHIVPATWPDAQLRCHLEDATLTAPTTSAITAVMKKTMVAHKLAESSVFTDMYASNPKGVYTNINGLKVSSSLQWAVGEPNNLGNEEDCLVMTGAGELADVSCSSVHPFFCLKRNIARTRDECNTTREANPCDTTAEGYTLEPRTGSCYKFHSAALPWRRAAMTCASERAHLAVINSEEESRVLKDIFAQNPNLQLLRFRFCRADYTNIAHIGFLDWNESGQWLTVFGETLEEAGFNKWESGQPNHSIGNDYCGSVERTGKFNDMPCTSINLAYICEISPKL